MAGRPVRVDRAHLHGGRRDRLVAPPRQPLRPADGRRGRRDVRVVALLRRRRGALHARAGVRPDPRGAVPARLPGLSQRSPGRRRAAGDRGRRLRLRRRPPGRQHDARQLRPRQPAGGDAGPGRRADRHPDPAHHPQRVHARGGRGAGGPPAARGPAGASLGRPAHRLVRARPRDDRLPVHQRRLGQGGLPLGPAGDALRDRPGAGRVPARAVPGAARARVRGRPARRPPRRAEPARAARRARAPRCATPRSSSRTGCPSSTATPTSTDGWRRCRDPDRGGR